MFRKNATQKRFWPENKAGNMKVGNWPIQLGASSFAVIVFNDENNEG
jgi:hypothetical protein